MEKEENLIGVMNMKHRLIYHIAQDILKDWASRGKHWDLPEARQYLDAMMWLKTTKCTHGTGNRKMSADSIIRYFLCNVGLWRGQKAPELKQELKDLIHLDV
tara:strand:- start:581 stop:886 length:306 start_codon:yes stop_codon:yes gene_type:complete